MLVYNCLLSFNWVVNLGKEEMLIFCENLVDLGFKFQFIILAGFYVFNISMFELVSVYWVRGMAGYFEFQECEFVLVDQGFVVICYQSFVGIGYFDYV